MSAKSWLILNFFCFSAWAQVELTNNSTLKIETIDKESTNNESENNVTSNNGSKNNETSNKESTINATVPITVSGLLRERGTRKILKDVSVFVLPHKLKVSSNLKGQFKFESVPKGPCTLVINLTGYSKFEKNLDCDKSIDLNVYLEKVFYTSFETTITGKVDKRDDQGQSLTQEEFIKAPGSFGGDPVRAAQNLPGVASQGASAAIIIQGSSPEDTGYVVNGHRVPLIFHFGGLSSVIIPEAVDRVELLPSGYGPEYSRAIGGVIGLTTKAPKTDRLHGMAYLDLLNTGGLVEGPLSETSSILVSGRYSYVGQVLKAAAEENESTTLTAAPTFYDFTSVYQKKLGSNNILNMTLLASKDRLELVANEPFDNDPSLRGELFNSTEFFRLIPRLTTQLNSKHKMDHSLGLGQDKIILNFSDNYFELRSQVLSHRSEIVSEWTKTYKTFLGLDNQWNDSYVALNLPTQGASVGGVPSPFSVGEERKFDTQIRQSQLGVYLRQEFKLAENSKWTFLPNLRLDYFSVNQDTKLQPRIQLRYQWDPSLLLRASAGSYVQSPQPQESSKEYGNENLKSPKATHFNFGFTKNFKNESNEGLEFTNNYFYKELKDLIFSDVDQIYANSGTGTILGSEIQAKYKFGPWTSQLVYTFLKSDRTIPGFGTQPSESDQTHNLNLIGSYTNARWTFSARLRFVSGLPYTPVIGATYDSDNDVYIPTIGQIYSKRFSPFSQLDLRIDRKFIYDTWILSAYLDIQNLLNSENIQQIEYAYDYSENEFVMGLPLLPTFGIKAEF